MPEPLVTAYSVPRPENNTLSISTAAVGPLGVLHVDVVPTVATSCH